MNFIMNERKYAEKILAGDGYGENYAYTTAVLAKYYKSQDMAGKDIRARLKETISERVPGAAPQSVRKWIDNGLEISSKYLLTEIERISITKPEMEIIKAIHTQKFKDESIQRFAFTLLCFAKYESVRGVKNGWVNIKQKELFSAADLSGMTLKRQDYMIGELKQMGLIENNPVIGRFALRVLFSQDGATEVFVENINEAGMIFQQYNGRKFYRCEDCGKMVRVTNGHGVRCKMCAEERNRAKTRERMNKKLRIA